MTDRKKVIKGLEHCRNRSFCNDGCPYNYIMIDSNFGIDECTSQLAQDALELLKEQEAPIYNEQKYGDHLPHCGNCEKALPNNVVYGKVNFCHYCGKAVKRDDVR